MIVCEFLLKKDFLLEIVARFIPLNAQLSPEYNTLALKFHTSQK